MKSSRILIIVGLLIQLISLLLMANIFKAPAEGNTTLELLLEAQEKIVEFDIFSFLFYLGCWTFFVGFVISLRGD